MGRKVEGREGGREREREREGMGWGGVGDTHRGHKRRIYWIFFGYTGI
jgi:hypothetical protein